MRNAFAAAVIAACLSISAVAQSTAPAQKPATPPSAGTSSATTPSSGTAQGGQQQKRSVSMIMDRQLTTLENELVPLAEALPDDKYNFAPSNGEFKGVRTFAQQVKHIAATNYLLFSGIVGEQPPANAKGDNGPDNMTAKADIVKYLKDSFTLGHKAMATLNEGNLTESLPANPFGGQGPAPSKLGAASLTIWHSFDHYGQMVVYLRMNGIIPPASRQQQ